jgi:hypothetical protein
MGRVKSGVEIRVTKVVLNKKERKKWNVNTDECYFLVRQTWVENVALPVDYKLMAPFNLDSDAEVVNAYLTGLEDEISSAQEE